MATIITFVTLGALHNLTLCVSMFTGGFMTKTFELDNVIQLPLPVEVDETEWVYSEFPYKHLLPVLEAA